MKNIYTFGGQPVRRNLTVADPQQTKGKNIFSQVTAYTTEEAGAAAEAGIDIVTTDSPMTEQVRMGAPETFIHTAIGLTGYRSENAVIEAAFEAMAAGPDADYTLHSLERVRALKEYHAEVHSDAFPLKENSISIDTREFERFISILDQKTGQ